MLLQILKNEFPWVMVIMLCLCVSAFFAAAETAITSLGVLKVKHLLEINKSATSLKLWLKHPARVITTLLVFNNVVNILASAVTTQITNKYTENGALGIATGIAAFLVLIFGEIVPKAFAKSQGDRFAIWTMRVVSVVYYACLPVIWLLSSFANLIVRTLSHGQKEIALITEEELEFLVSEGEKAGVIHDIKKDIIEGAFDFDETTVREIMTPRTDLAAVELNTSLEDVLALVIKTGHSRIPVFRDDIDHVVGMILAKDLLNFVKEEDKLKNTSVKELMRDALFAPESKSIMEVFKDLKKTKSHMAVVIDEYGGTAGIVSMEDILEEIVGDIQDEFDAEEAKILKIGDNIFEVSGTMNIEDFFEYFKLDVTDLEEKNNAEMIDTLSGWVTQLIGQMPKPGQKARIANLALEVVEVQNRRISIVRVEVQDKKALPEKRVVESQA